MDITLLFGINFGRIRTRWKEKIVDFAMEQCFSTGSVLEIERKIREDEVLLKYPFYPLFILDNGMNSISKSLTVLTPA